MSKQNKANESIQWIEIRSFEVESDSGEKIQFGSYVPSLKNNNEKGGENE